MHSGRVDTEIDELLWSLRADAHARSYRLGLGDEAFWRAYAVAQVPGHGASTAVDLAALDAHWEEVGRELSEVHLHWRTVGGWPPGEPVPAEAGDWRIAGVRVLDLAPADPALARRLARVAVQTVRRLAELPPRRA